MRRAALRTQRRSWSLFAALLAVGALLAWAPPPPAQAAPLQVRGDSDQVHELVESVTSNFPNYDSATENIEFLRDRDPTKKWYARNSGQPTPANPVWAIYTLSEPAKVTAYSLTSANDAPERDPKDWTILGSNDPAAAADANHASWVQLDARRDERFQARFQRNIYAIQNPGTYRYYQLRVTANLANSTASNNTRFQVADWTLRSDAPGYGSALITSETEWSYLDDGTVDPSPGPDRTAWTQVGASLPSTWKTGLGPFGAKNGGTDLGAGFPVTTLLKHYLDGASAPVVPAYFFRTTFELDQAALDSIKGLYGSLVHDDAVAIYINGVEVYADYEGSTVTQNLQYAGGTLTDPRTKAFVIPADALRVGENVVAVELHNVNDTSSDIYLALPTLAAMSERVPAPYTSAQLNRHYASDDMPPGDNGGDFFVDLLDGFADLLTYHPHILAANFDLPISEPLVAANDKVAVAINNGAVGHSAKIAQAIADADGQAYATMADGFGTVLGPLYAQALNQGMLPKTRALLGTLIERGRDHEPAKAAYAYKRPYNRLGFATGSQCATFTGAGRIERNYTGSYSGLCTNGSFPSGHANHGYAQGTVLATLIPELAPQILHRTSEYGNNRIVLGFHYPLDVMGGRIAGQSTAAQRWADPEFRELIEEASEELHDILGEACEDAGYSRDLEECAEAGDIVSDEEALEIYTERLTYSTYTLADGSRHEGFPPVYQVYLDTPAEIPAEAADLLRSAFPDLTDEQRELVLKATAAPGGYALDKTKDGKPSWQRINLLAAMIADVEIDQHGNTIVNGRNMGGGTPVEATLTAATRATTYNVPAKVSVQVSAPGIVPEGIVRVSGGATELAAAELADGAAELELPRALPAGKHTLTVTFEPSSVGVTAPPPQELELRVKKAKAALAGVAIKKGKRRKNRIAKGAKAAVQVVLRGVGAAAPTGKVQVKVGKAKLGSARVRERGKHYVALVRFKARKAGRIVIAYSGSPNLRKATYRTAIAVR